MSSTGWIKKFFKRNNLALRRRKTRGQRDSSDLFPKLVNGISKNRSQFWSLKEIPFSSSNITSVWKKMRKKRTKTIMLCVGWAQWSDLQLFDSFWKLSPIHFYNCSVCCLDRMLALRKLLHGKRLVAIIRKRDNHLSIGTRLLRTKGIITTVISVYLPCVWRWQNLCHPTRESPTTRPLVLCALMLWKTYTITKCIYLRFVSREYKMPTSQVLKIWKTPESIRKPQLL